MHTRTLVTAEELERMPEDGSRYELIAGVIRKMPHVGWQHGDAASCLDEMLRRQVRENRLGRVFAGGVGFVLARDPDTVPAPDTASIAKDRLPAQRPKTTF